MKITMKKLTLFFYFLFLINLSQAQNLVPNWSFEDTVACPVSLTQIDKAIGWSSFGGTPDYFNACAPNSGMFNVSVPENVWGYQFSNTGNAYAAFLSFGLSATNMREFIGVELLNNLIMGETYYVSFYISTAFGYANGQYPGLASNNIGAKFSTIPYSSNNPPALNNYSHINEANIISDTINWIKISGSFIADSAYKYLIIGNFFDDANTTYSSIGTIQNVSVYYLDDIKVSNDSDFVNSSPNVYSVDFIKIFPNPARDWITVEGRRITKISLYDVLGNICLSFTVSASSLSFNVSTLTKGLYILKIEIGNENIKRKILIH